MQVGIEVSSTRSQPPELIFDSLQFLFPVPSAYSPSKVIRGNSAVVDFVASGNSTRMVRAGVAAIGGHEVALAGPHAIDNRLREVRR